MSVCVCYMYIFFILQLDDERGSRQCCLYLQAQCYPYLQAPQAQCCPYLETGGGGVYFLLEETLMPRSKTGWLARGEGTVLPLYSDAKGTFFFSTNFRSYHTPNIFYFSWVMGDWGSALSCIFG